MQAPSQGRIVTVRGDGVKSNGTHEQAAVITRVWWHKPDEKVAMVNLQVFCDCGPTISVTSVNMYSDRQAAEDAGVVGTHAFWPDRV